MVPTFSWGAEFHAPRRAETEAVRRAIAKAAWGNSHAQRSLELLYTLVWDGWQVDPVQALQVQAFEQVLANVPWMPIVGVSAAAAPFSGPSLTKLLDRIMSSTRVRSCGAS